MAKWLFTEDDRLEFEAIEQDRAPALDSFGTDDPEFYRWYEYGGALRLRPLSVEELVGFYVDQGYTEQDAYEYVLAYSRAVPGLLYQRYGDWCKRGRLRQAKRTPTGTVLGRVPAL